jgi:hypothetical protein
MNRNALTMPIIVLMIVSFLLMAMPNISIAQTVSLNADGPGSTYELINAMFDPGNSAVENPECVHAAFGRHVAEVFDPTLNKFVFQFYSHVAEDNDRCVFFDRQRIEITTTPSSNSNVKTINGETVTYKWKFKLPVGFQPSSSFTHIHQVKAVGGDEGSPIFTLTPRKGTPNLLELIYVLDSTSGTSKLATVPLSIFEGIWVEATEVVKAGATGAYSIELKKVSDGTTLLSYRNNNIVTIRPSNSFIRPKWGIYRSLANTADLRNETMDFADFVISEGSVPLAPNTYYWVGGTALTGFKSGSNWNTQLNGTGNSRSSIGSAIDDVLIVDGSNVGGSTPTTGAINATVSSDSIAQLKLQNNAILFLQRATPVPPATAGSGTVTILGDGTIAPDFVVSSGCSLTLNSPVTDGTVNINLPINATGKIGGVITISNSGLHRITSQTTNGLVFNSGATFNSSAIPTTAAYPFGSASQAIQNGVVFEAGANLIVTGNRSPMGGSSSFQACNMLPNSNFYFRTSNAANTGSYTNLKTYGNIFIENGAIVTADGPFYKIDNLTINNGCSLITHTSGSTPVLGNLVVNGSLTAPTNSTNSLIMAGGEGITVSGTGIINVPTFVVTNKAAVTLSKSINVSIAGNVIGKLDFGTTSQIAGTGTFTSRTNDSALAVTGNITAGSYLITNVVGSVSSISGLTVKGNGIDATADVVGSSSGGATINMSKPATSTATGISLAFKTDSATLITANPNGMDSTNGSVVVTGIKSFQSGTNYVINGATNKPFGISSIVGSTIIVGKVIINASVTSNFQNIRVTAGLFIKTGNFNIRSTDSVKVVLFTMPFNKRGLMGEELQLLQHPTNTNEYLAIGHFTNTQLNCFSIPLKRVFAIDKYFCFNQDIHTTNSFTYPNKIGLTFSKQAVVLNGIIY